MDVVDRENVKIPNAVLVSGLEGKDDEEILEFLKKYGSIQRTIYIDQDPNSEFHTNLIVEYTSGSALEALEALLPYSQPSTKELMVTYYVQALASVYSKTAGNSVTQLYLDELKKLAALSQKSLEEILKDAISQIGEAIDPSTPSPENHEPAAEPSQPVTPPRQLMDVPFTYQPQLVDAISSSPPQLLVDVPSPSPQLLVHGPFPTKPGLSDIQSISLAPSVRPKTPLSLSAGELNPPEVQKIVVEHIVRSDDKPSHFHTTLRLRAFSGKTPKPHTEVDYDTWRSHVDLMMKDTSVSTLEKTRRILESLLVPALDVIRHLGPEASPTAFLQILDSAFAPVEDGEELFVRFMGTLQDSGEKASTYLQRLRMALNNAVRRGGVPVQDTDRHLLKQFCRGCWDNSLLADLQLEQKKKDPPSFAELLVQIRTEEERQDSKTLRMKQHLGATKQKAVAHVQSVKEETQATSDASSIDELRKQVAELKSQLTVLTEKKKQRRAYSNKKTSSETETQKPDQNAKTEFKATFQKDTSSKPKPWYCFRCGENGHIVATCESDENPALVASKRTELRQRQQLWEAQNPTLN